MFTDFKLSVGVYDNNEAEAIERTCNRVIQAFGAANFSSVGYPTRVKTDAALFRYIDCMQETRLERDFLHFLEGVTRDEYQLLKEAISITAAYSRERFSRVVAPRGALIRSINMMRHIEYVYGDERPCVFEIGPGSGYLGLLLQMKGYPYAATDITQGYYLHQSNLWEFANGGRIEELALADADYVFDFDDIKPNVPVHVPWWHMADMLLSNRCVRPSLITCNHAFAEMNKLGLAFYVALAFKALENSRHAPTVMFEDMGEEHIPYVGVFDRFLGRGFRLCINDERVTTFVPDWDEAGARDALDMNDFFVFLESCGYDRTNVLDKRSVFPTVTRENNPICAKILEGRKNSKKNAVVTLPELIDEYKKVTGRERYFTDDEKFLLAMDCCV